MISSISQCAKAPHANNERRKQQPFIHVPANHYEGLVRFGQHSPEQAFLQRMGSWFNKRFSFLKTIVLKIGDRIMLVKNLIHAGAKVLYKKVRERFPGLPKDFTPQRPAQDTYEPLDQNTLAWIKQLKVRELPAEYRTPEKLDLQLKKLDARTRDHVVLALLSRKKPSEECYYEFILWNHLLKNYAEHVEDKEKLLQVLKGFYKARKEVLPEGKRIDKSHYLEFKINNPENAKEIFALIKEKSKTNPEFDLEHSFLHNYMCSDNPFEVISTIFHPGKRAQYGSYEDFIEDVTTCILGSSIPDAEHWTHTHSVPKVQSKKVYEFLKAQCHQQPHEFGPILTGLFIDIMRAIYKDEAPSVEEAKWMTRYLNFNWTSFAFDYNHSTRERYQYRIEDELPTMPSALNPEVVNRLQGYIASRLMGEPQLFIIHDKDNKYEKELKWVIEQYNRFTGKENFIHWSDTDNPPIDTDKASTFLGTRVGNLLQSFENQPGTFLLEIDATKPDLNPFYAQLSALYNHHTWTISGPDKKTKQLNCKNQSIFVRLNDAPQNIMQNLLSCDRRIIEGFTSLKSRCANLVLE